MDCGGIDLFGLAAAPEPHARIVRITRPFTGELQQQRGYRDSERFRELCETCFEDCAGEKEDAGELGFDDLVGRYLPVL